MSTTRRGAPATTSFRPTDAQVVQFLQANAVFGETLRFRQLDRYEAHYKCEQYAHQKYDWWGRVADLMETVSPDAVAQTAELAPAEGLALRAKRPTAPRNLCKTIVKRFTGMLFSEQRKPRVIVEGDPDTEAMLEAIREDARFWSVMRAARNKAGSMGAVGITVHVRDGRFSFEVHNPKHITVVWKDRRTLSPAGFLKMYKYPVEEDVKDEKTGEVVGTRQVDYLYRRIITEEVDVVYQPARMDDPDSVASWEPDPALSVDHALGFFPGVWIQNSAESDDLDGDPDCDGAWQGLDTIDRLLSQMNKGVILNLDPTPVIKHDPKATNAAGGLRKGSENAIYPGVDGDAKYMEMSGQAIEVALKLLAELKQGVLDVTQCVLLDPEKISGAAQSAKAIEYLFQPMIEAADDLRALYGEAVVRLMRITEKIVRAFATPIPLPDGKVGVFRFDLPPRRIGGGDGKLGAVEDHALGRGGYVKLEWGQYFMPTADDEGKEIRNAVEAHTGGLVDRPAAIRKVADTFKVQDVEAMARRVEAEMEEMDARALGAAGAGEGGGFDGGVPDDAGEARGPAAGQGGRP